MGYIIWPSDSHHTLNSLRRCASRWSGQALYLDAKDDVDSPTRVCKILYVGEVTVNIIVRLRSNHEEQNTGA